MLPGAEKLRPSSQQQQGREGKRGGNTSMLPGMARQLGSRSPHKIRKFDVVQQAKLKWRRGRQRDDGDDDDGNEEAEGRTQCHHECMLQGVARREAEAAAAAVWLQRCWDSRRATLQPLKSTAPVERGVRRRGMGGMARKMAWLCAGGVVTHARTFEG